MTLFARLKTLGPVFLLTVVMPTLVSIVYFGLIASDVYVSEAKFVIRSPSKVTKSGFGVLLDTVGFSHSDDDLSVVNEYIVSRDALQVLNADGKVERAFNKPSISLFDRFDPLSFDRTFEALYSYYRKRVSVDRDTGTTVTTLAVRAYTPADAQRINARLLTMAEQQVNRLSRRVQTDVIRFAETEVDSAKARSLASAQALSRFRNANGIVDPERQANVQMQLISKLQDELIANRIQLAELRRLAPRNPQVDVLQTRIGSLQTQVDEELGKVAGQRKSLAATAVGYQRLQLENQFADRELTAALASLQDAQSDARRQQSYVERVVQPNLPDRAQEPRRFRSIFATFILGLVAWGIATMLLAGVREHQD